MLVSIFAAAVVAFASVYAQGDLTAANNVTGLQGTWSTGSGAVSTGGNICRPAEYRFEYPVNTGMSYSFTDTGFFEEVLYRYDANASNPACITARISWQHGTYGLNDNGSLSLYPFPTDGRIQVQDPCASVTNVITEYNQFVLMADWGITIDGQTANYVLRMNQFDGAKLPPMFLIANPPNMLPTQVLTGANATGQTTSRKRSFKIPLIQRSAAPRSSTAPSDAIIVLAALGSAALAGLASYAL